MPTSVQLLSRSGASAPGCSGDRIGDLVPRAVETIAELMTAADVPPLLRLRAAEAILDRSGWAGGVQQRRIDAEITAEVDGLIRALFDKVEPEVLDKVVAALGGPLPETTKTTPARPRIEIRVHRRDDDSDAAADDAAEGDRREQAEEKHGA
jgi:hypothetical protein